MIIQIIQGIKKFDLDIPCSSSEKSENEDSEMMDSTGDSQNEWTFEMLKRKIEELTDIPADCQRLIHKGKTLNLQDRELLSAINLKAKEKIMVLGHPKEDDAVMKNLKKVEREIIMGIESKISEIDKDVDAIEKGFLAQDLVGEALKKLDKRVKGLGEDCMRTLELLDGLVIGVNQTAHRTKRKTLVNMLNDILSRNDKIEERVRNKQNGL